MHHDFAYGPDHRRQSRPRPSGALAGALIVVALVAAACSGGSAAPGVAAIGATTSTTGVATGPPLTASPATYAKDVAYAGCMRTHGVPNMPDPNSQGNFLLSSKNGVDARSPRYIAADNACQHLLPNGGRQTPAEQRQSTEVALKLVACMRAHGEPNFPEPIPDGNGGLNIRIGGGGMDPQSPQFLAAKRACQLLFDQFGAIP
jgi:hypothetical protein